MDLRIPQVNPGSLYRCGEGPSIKSVRRRSLVACRQSIVEVFDTTPEARSPSTRQPAADALVVGLGPGVLVSVLTPLASEGAAAAPPSLLVLNKGLGADDDTRMEVTVNMTSAVVGYAPVEADCAAGTSNACQVLVLGSTIRLRLLPGEAEYVQLVMAQ